jgi:hypothetical protein
MFDTWQCTGGGPGGSDNTSFNTPRPYSPGGLGGPMGGMRGKPSQVMRALAQVGVRLGCDGCLV